MSSSKKDSTVASNFGERLSPFKKFTRELIEQHGVPDEGSAPPGDGSHAVEVSTVDARDLG